MVDETTKKRCFVICPIGERDSPIRHRSDDIFKHLIQPIAEQLGYVAERVNDNDRPGDITSKIVGDIIEADVIIADITGHNPNVFYELAIAHAWKKPCILMSGEDPVRVPFDIGSQNVIQIRLDGFGAADATRTILGRHFESVGQNGGGSDNPVSRYERGRELEKSTDPIAREVADLRGELAKVKSTVRGAMSAERLRSDSPSTPRREHDVSMFSHRSYLKALNELKDALQGETCNAKYPNCQDCDVEDCEHHRAYVRQET